MNDIEKLHFAEYSDAPDIIVEVPQPVTLLGAFADYVDGFSLMCTVSDGMMISASLRDDNNVRIYNASKQDKKKFLLSSIKYRKEDKWANPIKAIVLSFQSSGYRIRGMNIAIYDSSSSEGETMNAMLFAGISMMINELYKLCLPLEEILSMARKAMQFSSSCRSKERDIIAIFESRENYLLSFDLAGSSHAHVSASSSLCSCCYMLDSSIPSSIMLQLLDEFRAELIPVFSSFRKAFPKEKNLLYLSDKEIRSYSRQLPEIDRHYIEYVLEESSMARKGAELISSGNVIGFGRLLSLQQRNLADKAELTSPETDWLVKRALELSSVSGIAQISLGRPGMMLILIESESELEYTSRLEEYERIFGFHAVLRRFAPYGSIRIIG